MKRKTGRRIIIVSINAYCGGTIALASMCASLRSIGYDARLFLVPYFPSNEISKNKYLFDRFIYLTKYKSKRFIKDILVAIFPHANFTKSYKSYARLECIPGVKIQHCPFIFKDSICIYSEDVYGNPLKVTNVVRWLLYFYDYKIGSAAYSSSDIFIAFRDVFDNSILNPNKYVVTFNYFNSKLYQRYNFGERKGNCYIIHKGSNRADLPNSFDGPVFNHNMTDEQVVEMLNNAKYCYCYDTQSFWSSIAAICGCISIVVPEEGKSEHDYYGKGEKHLGVAIGKGESQIQYARETSQLLIQSLDYSASNRKNAEKLANILELKFGKIRKIKGGTVTEFVDTLWRTTEPSKFSIKEKLKNYGQRKQ